ncbi:hypothetical protein DFH28DRAFT_864437, partial [Melampsora americana]
MSHNNRRNIFRRARSANPRDSDTSFACRGLYNYSASQFRSQPPNSANSDESFACRGISYEDEELERSGYASEDQSNSRRHYAFYEDYYGFNSNSLHHLDQNISPQPFNSLNDPSAGRSRRRQAVLFDQGYNPTREQERI